MPNQITVTTIVNADIKKAWEYYTEPKHIVNWNFASLDWCCPRATNDMTIGGMYNARMEARDGSVGFDFEGIYTEIDLGKSFKYGFGGRECNVKFEEVEGGTKVTVSFDPETENPIEMQHSGWQSILDNYKKYVEQTIGNEVIMMNAGVATGASLA